MGPIVIGARPAHALRPAAGLAPTTPELAPPLLVGEHFAAALVYFALGAIGLGVAAPDLAHGRFYLPRVVAIVHLFTLGWIVLSIFGALCQFLPVAVGRPLRSTKIAHLSFAAQALGVACFVTALIVGSRSLLLCGAFALTLAFVSFGANLAVTLAGARERGFTFWALAAATVSLLATPVYGILLAFYVHDGGLQDPFATMGEHAHIAIVGFVLIVMVGVAHRLLPMFLLTHGVSERPAWVALALLFGSASLLIVHHVGGVARVVAAGGLGCAGVVAMIVQAAMFFRGRKRRSIDPGMCLAASGLVGLAVAVVLAPFALTRGTSDVRLLTTYFVVVLGAISLFIAGHYYKVVPFLVWNHRFGPLLGKRKVPKVAELYSEKVARANVALLVSGLVGLAIGTYVGSELLARAAATVFAAGALLEVVVIARVAQRKVA